VTANPRAVGLPGAVTACLFDLDGVLTRTATLHAAAWKATFDDYLRGRARETGEPFVPFDVDVDYGNHVDGKPREAGVRDFLASRGIVLPEGPADDGSRTATVRGLAGRKNRIMLDLIRSRGVDVYPGSVEFVRAVRSAGLRTAVVSSSANAGEILRVAGIEPLFELRVDGLVAAARHLGGKPAPDTFLAAVEALGSAPAQGAVFEDALAGVQAARAGGFACVVGVDHARHAQALLANGATMVVRDLAELLPR